MATKKAKKVTTPEIKIDFTNSIDKIKGTAKTLNNEVLTTATEVLEDIRNNSEKIKAAATTSVNEAIEAVKNVKLENSVTYVKETAKNINKYSLETAENVLETAVAGGKEWQRVAKTAIDGGLELADKNQEIVLETLEAVKGQFTQSAKRFSRLLNNN